jgi:O-antigen ligase
LLKIDGELLDVFSKNTLILLVVFLFPILIATVKHGGGLVYSLLLLFGLFLGWSSWKVLLLWEKKALIGFVIFFALLSFSFVNTQDVYNGVKRIEKLTLFPLLVPMYLLVRKYQVETGKIYLLGMFFASFIMFGQAYYQVSILDWDRAIGAYNPLILGDVSMLIAVVIFFALMILSKIRLHYVLGGLAVFFALFTSVLSGARGAWILLPIIVVWFMWEKRKNLRPIHLMFIVLISSLTVVGSYEIPYVKSRVNIAINDYQAYTQDATKRSSVQIRMELWKDSISIWKEQPIIGTGVGDYHRDVTQLVENGRSNTQEVFGHAHSIYFDTLAVSGLVGLFALLIFVLLIPFLMFRSLWIKEDDPWVRFYALSGMVVIIAFAVFGLTESWLSRNAFVRTYLMSILVFMSSIAARKQFAEIKNHDKKINT